MGIDEDGLAGAPVRVPARRVSRPRAAEPCPLSGARARRAARTRRGQGLQADRAGAVALGQHGAHPPAQRLQEDRRGRPSAGGPDRPRPRAGLVVPPSTVLRSGASRSGRSARRSRRRGRGCGLEPADRRLGVGADGLGLEAEALGGVLGREAVGESCRTSRWRRVRAVPWPLVAGSTKRSDSAAASTAARGPRAASSWRRRPRRPPRTPLVIAWRSGRPRVGDDPHPGHRLANRADHRGAAGSPLGRSRGSSSTTATSKAPVSVSASRAPR